MKEIQKIVCAVDLAEFLPEVVEYAATMAKTLKAEVLVVYAAPSFTQYSAFEIQPKALQSFGDEISLEAEKHMQDVLEKYFADVMVEGRVLVGHPADEVINLAEDEGADMIIMGTHGRQGMDLLLFGSVADKVVKNAEMPVLTIRPGTGKEAGKA